MKHLIPIITTIALTACGESKDIDHTHDGAKPATETAEFDPSKIVPGNGEQNYITLDGASRDGNVFTIPQVVIAQTGFLVMHPFRDGAPVQTEYVGAVPVPEGTSGDVDIEVSVDVAAGDKFIVMLHNDMNRDGIFDFGDGITVPDAPVFEGYTLVALRYEAP